MERLLKSQEAREILQLSSAVFWERVGSGEIPSVRLGPRIVRFREKDLARYIEENVVRRADDGDEIGSDGGAERGPK